MEAKTKFEEDRIAKNEEFELIMTDLGLVYGLFIALRSRNNLTRPN